MLFKQAALGDERAFVTGKNVEATSITTGMGAALRLGTTASFDGTQMVRAIAGNAGDLPGFLGISVKDIPSNAYGLIQTYGNTASVLLSVTTTSITITAGDPLIPGAVAGTLFSGVPTYAASGFNWVIASNPPTGTLSQAAPLYCSGFVRCIK
jgi:hypothetical protein